MSSLAVPSKNGNNNNSSRNDNSGGLNVVRDKSGANNNNNNNNGSVEKKTLVTITDKRSSTRSLSCFANPELSSKDLPLSEELTFDMYGMGILGDSAQLESGASRRQRQEAIVAVNEGGGTNGIVNLKTSTGDNNNNSSSSSNKNNSNNSSSNGSGKVNTETYRHESVEYVKIANSRDKLNSLADELNGKSSAGFKRSNAVDKESMGIDQNGYWNARRMPGVIEDSEADVVKLRGDNEGDFRGGKTYARNESECQVIEVKQNNSKDNGQGGFQSPRETPTLEQRANQSKSPLQSKTTTTAMLRSEIASKERFDSFGSEDEIDGGYNFARAEAHEKSKSKMMKSPPPDDQWAESVEVPLWKSKDEITFESTADGKLIDGKHQWNDFDRIEIQRSRKFSKDEEDLADEARNGSGGGSLGGSDIRDRLESLAGLVGEKREFFNSLDSEREFKRGEYTGGTLDRKHLEIFENVGRGREEKEEEEEESRKRNNNLRGRTSANRSAIDRNNVDNSNNNSRSNNNNNNINKQTMQDRDKFLNDAYSGKLRAANNNNNNDDGSGSGGQDKRNNRLNENNDLYLYNSNNGIDNRRTAGSRESGSGDFKRTNGDATTKMAKRSNYETSVSTRKSKGTPINDDNDDGGFSPTSDASGDFDGYTGSGRRAGGTSVESIRNMIERKDGGNPASNQRAQQQQQLQRFPREANGLKADDHSYERPNQRREKVSGEGGKINGGANKGNRNKKKPGTNYSGRQDIWLENAGVTGHPRKDNNNNNGGVHTYIDVLDEEYEEEEGEEEEEEEESTYKTIIKTTTRQIKQTIPSGTVTVAKDDNKRKQRQQPQQVANNISGSITKTEIDKKAQQKQQQQAANNISGSITKIEADKKTQRQNSISGTIDVHREEEEEGRRVPRLADIEVVAIGGRNDALPPSLLTPSSFSPPNRPETRGYMAFDSIGIPSLLLPPPPPPPPHFPLLAPSVASFSRFDGQAPDGFIVSPPPPLIETEISVDPELRDASKYSGAYKITMNLNRLLLVSSRPGSAVPSAAGGGNSSFSSPPLSALNQRRWPLSRQDSGSAYGNFHSPDGYGTSNGVVPSVFSAPAAVNQTSFGSSASSNRGNHQHHHHHVGSGTVVVSVDGASSNHHHRHQQQQQQQHPVQGFNSDVAFDLSLQGRTTPTTAAAAAAAKSSATRARTEFARPVLEVSETIETKTTLKQTPRDDAIDGGGGGRQRKVDPNKKRPQTSSKSSERTSGKSGKSGQRIATGDETSWNRAAILHSALDVNLQAQGRGAERPGAAAPRVARSVSFEGDNEVETLDRHQRTGYVAREPEQRSEFRAVADGAREFPAAFDRHKNHLQSLEEEGEFDRDVEIGKKSSRAQLASGGWSKTETTKQQQQHQRDEYGAIGSQRRIEEINKFDLQALLRGAAADSVKQRISVKRLGDKLTSGPEISEELRERLARDELPPSENDKVAEEISMHVDDGRVTMTSEVLCEKTVPVYNSLDTYKTSSVQLTRIVEVDLSVTPERRKLYDLLVGPDIERRSMSEGEKRELYAKFMALAEHSRKGIL